MENNPSSRPLKLIIFGANGGIGKQCVSQALAAGITRAFFISASALETSPALPPFVRFISKYVIQQLLKHSYADLRRMEAIIRSSDADWTIVRPPQLTDKPFSPAYRFAVNTYLKNALKVSRATVAHFMLPHATDSTTHKATI